MKRRKKIILGIFILVLLIFTHFSSFYLGAYYNDQRLYPWYADMTKAYVFAMGISDACENKIKYLIEGNEEKYFDSEEIIRRLYEELFKLPTMQSKENKKLWEDYQKKLNISPTPVKL